MFLENYFYGCFEKCIWPLRKMEISRVLNLQRKIMNCKHMADIFIDNIYYVENL